jgi:hypothetical protein
VGGDERGGEHDAGAGLAGIDQEEAGGAAAVGQQDAAFDEWQAPCAGDGETCGGGGADFWAEQGGEIAIEVYGK